MSLAVGIRGERGLFDMAKALREAGEKDLAAELSRGIRKAATSVEREVRRSTDTYMPKGFEKTFASSLRSKVQVRLSRDRRISIEFIGLGKARERDLASMERGRLRHPVYGRYRRLSDGTRMTNPWVTQQIRPGWASEPARRAAPKAAKDIGDAMGKVAAKIERAI
ncbi:hypothetical protein [Catelliglobosispora koreensis]|uniref:hypothetical protein n=1 Tax=Catelliglobosispora koreensis TaxID=129052 RepID=UPI00038070DE|nr:hypothetical protein [Catelliglobosispora koreensis]